MQYNSKMAVNQSIFAQSKSYGTPGASLEQGYKILQFDLGG